jgi:hypothetical protein
MMHTDHKILHGPWMSPTRARSPSPSKLPATFSTQKLSFVHKIVKSGRAGCRVTADYASRGCILSCRPSLRQHHTNDTLSLTCVCVSRHHVNLRKKKPEKSLLAKHTQCFHSHPFFTICKNHAFHGMCMHGWMFFARFAWSECDV